MDLPFLSWRLCGNRNQNDCTVPGELSFFVCQRLTHWQSGFARTYARHVFAQRTIACFGNLHFWIKHVFFGNFKVGVWGHRPLWVLHLSPQVQDFSKSLHRNPPGQSQFYSEYFLLSLHITTHSVFVQIHLEACMAFPDITPMYLPSGKSQWLQHVLASLRVHRTSSKRTNLIRNSEVEATFIATSALKWSFSSQHCILMQVWTSFKTFAKVLPRQSVQLAVGIRNHQTANMPRMLEHRQGGSMCTIYAQCAVTFFDFGWK